MVGVANLVVLACAWTAAVAVPALRQACHPVQNGQLIGEQIRLEKTTLQAGVADWRVLIPDIPECPHGPVGVKALVCDYDVTANAYFESMNVIVIHRNGGLLYPGSVTPTVFCGNPQYQNNQPLLQNNQLYLSNNLPWQTNQNVAHLYSQSPLSLPSLGLASQSSLGQIPNDLLGKLPNNLLSLPQSLCGRSSLPSLSVTPLSYGQSSLGLSPLSLLDLSQKPSSGLSQQSALPSLSHSPLPHLDQSHNLLLGQPPQLLSSQSSLPLSAQAPLLLGQSSQQLLG